MAAKASKPARYALPNTSTVLPRYTNAEQDFIKESFSAVSFKTLHSLPVELRPNHVNESRANKVDANLTSAMPHAPYDASKRLHNTFQSFDYMPPWPTLAEELKAEETNKRLEKENEPVRVPFIPSSYRPSMAHANPAQAFADTQELSGVTPFYSDPYDDAENVALRAKWFQNSQILFGPFLPATKTRSISRPNKAMLPHMVSSIRNELNRDWTDCDFDIYCDEDDHVIIEFDLRTIDNPNGLVCYMNMLTNASSITSSWGLFKISQLWNHKPTPNTVYFGYRPWWVRQRITDSFYTVHPEMRTMRAEKQHLKEQERMKEAAAALERSAKEEKKGSLHQLIDDFYQKFDDEQQNAAGAGPQLGHFKNRSQAHGSEDVPAAGRRSNIIGGTPSSFTRPSETAASESRYKGGVGGGGGQGGLQRPTAEEQTSRLQAQQLQREQAQDQYWLEMVEAGADNNKPTSVVEMEVNESQRLRLQQQQQELQQQRQHQQVLQQRAEQEIEKGGVTDTQQNQQPQQKD